MEITIDTSKLMAILSLATAVGGLLAGVINLIIRFRKLEKHDKQDHETQIVILEALFAVLDGLKQQGCNGPVTEAREKLRKRVIES